MDSSNSLRNFCAAALLLLALGQAASAAENRSAPGPVWLDDYAAASEKAESEGRMLLVLFDNDEHTELGAGVQERIDSDPELQDKIADWVLVRVGADASIPVDGEPVRLLDHNAFREMQDSAGVAVIDYLHEGAEYHGRVVSAFPFKSGKYYDWREDYLAILADLPAGTLTQRTMVWAVREHHESPQSTEGDFSPEIAEIAMGHSAYQARVRVQGHQNWSSRAGRVRSAVGLGHAVEVVAESWPGQTMIDSCLDCVASWRHSSGHWGQVKRRHKLYGYDLRRGGNGIWYGTGIFAD